MDCQALLSMGFPSKNTGVGCHFLLQGIFLTQGSNLHLLHWQVDSFPLSCSLYWFPILYQNPWLLRKATKNCWLSSTGDLNLLLSSVKWILIARSYFLFIQVERIWKHICLALHIWLILFTLKANYIWCEGKMGFRNMGVLFMNFHSENVGHLFILCVCLSLLGWPTKVMFHFLSSKMSEWWNWPL